MAVTEARLRHPASQTQASGLARASDAVSANDFLDTTEVEQSDGQAVDRQVIVLGDPATLANYADVLSRAKIDGIGLLVHNMEDVSRDAVLREILAELKTMNLHLELITGAELNPGDEAR